MVTIPELYREFEKIDLQFIADCHADNGIMREFNEKCPDSYQRQIIDHFIRVNNIEIENAMEDVAYDRRTAQEFEELYGGGQGDIEPGDEVEPGRDAGGGCEGKEPNPLA